MKIHVGTAPDSWGIWFSENDRQIGWERCLDEMKAAGYEGVELGPWGYFPNEGGRLKEELQKRDLKLAAGTAGANYADDASVDAMLKFLEEQQIPLLKQFDSVRYIDLLVEMYTDLITGKYVMKKELSDEESGNMFRNINRTAAVIREHGYLPTLHPHVDCYIQTEEEIERVLENTDVELCLDTGHHVYGGGDPVTFYKKHHSRIPYLHVKECDLSVKKQMELENWSFAEAVTKDIMCEPGKGNIDFRKLFDIMKENGFDGWVVVEQDMYPVQDFSMPFQIARRTREYLKMTGI